MANKPKTISIGLIKINKWESEKFPGTFNYTIVKSYKDANQEWKETNNFSAQDMCVVKTLLDSISKSLINKPQAVKEETIEEEQNTNSQIIDDEIPF